MPNEKKPEQLFPERESGSLLKAGIASTPLVGASILSLRGIAVDGTIKSPRETGLDEAINRLSARNIKPHIPDPKSIERFMNKQSGDISKQAWKWAIGTVDPFTRKRLLSYTHGLDTMTEHEIRSAITQTAIGNESVEMAKVLKRFQNVSDILIEQTKISGTLPKFVPVEDLTEFAQKLMVPLAGEIPDILGKRIRRIAETLGVSKVMLRGVTRSEVASEGFGMWNVAFRGTSVGDIKIKLPQITGGILLEGSELQTRRIAPDILHIAETGEITKMGRSEFFLKELEESIVPEIGIRLKTEEDVKKAIRQLRTEVFGKLESTPNVPRERMTAAQAQREAQRGMAVDVIVEETKRRGSTEYIPSFRKPTAAEISRLLLSEKGQEFGLRGGVSPSGLAEGRLSTVEWERLYMGGPDYSRRPEQIYRGYQATPETVALLNQQNVGQKFRATEIAGKEAAYQNVIQPHLKTAYVDPEKYAQLLEEAAMGEGEAIMRARAMRKIEFETSKTFRLTQAREDIQNFQAIKEGEILGTTELGKVVKLPHGAKIMGVRRLTDQQIQVEYMQRHRLRHADKIFGAAKAVVLSRRNNEFQNILRRLHTAGNVDLIASMDELKKNKSLHKKQILSALEEVAVGSMKQRGLGYKPSWAIEPASHEEWLRKAMTVGIQELELTPKEFGGVFGAVPVVLGKEKAVEMLKTVIPEPSLSKQFEKQMLRNIAIGKPEFTYGGPRVDVGKLGSVESRAFNIIESTMGDIGRDVNEELIERLIARTPEKLTTHRELAKTLMSITKKGAPLEGKVFQYGQSFQHFLTTGGGVLRPKEGFDIYIPGADVVPALRPYKTPSGVTTRTKLAEIYHEMARKSELLQEEKISAKEFEKEMELLANRLRKEYAPAGKQTGGVLRGKIIGSRFLRGVSTMAGSAETAMREASTIGITLERFYSMYNELVRSGMYKDQLKELEVMKNNFLSGQNVAGMFLRHPLIGEFSVQPVYMKMIEGQKDLVVIPEIKQHIRLKTELEGEFKEKLFTLGPLVGLSGDKDADAYSLMMLSPRNEARVREMMLEKNNRFVQRYAQHQIRMQLFKAGKARKGAELPIIKQMASEIEKLSVGQKWIAPLSIELTAAKQAISKFGQGAMAADAKFLTEWLEQNIISAKHMSAEEAAGGGLEALMASTTEAVRARDMTVLNNNIQTIVKNDAVAKKMLTGNVYIDKAGTEALTKKLGTQISSEISGINVSAALSELGRVLGEADATGYTRKTELMAGRGARVKMKEIAEVAAKGIFRGSSESGGVFTKVATSMNTATNILGQVGRGLIRNHKYVGFGFAGSIAVAAALSDPPQIVGPGSAKIPNIKLNRPKAADRMKPEDLHPPQQSVGKPTPPLLMQNQTVRLGMNQPQTSNIRITGYARSGTDVTRMTSNISSSLDGNTSVNLRDNRSRLHPYDIASKLL